VAFPGISDPQGYVFKVFAPRFTAKIIKRVREGSLKLGSDMGCCFLACFPVRIKTLVFVTVKTLFSGAFATSA
jgi:hypothetical protein